VFASIINFIQLRLTGVLGKEGD